MLWFIKEMQVKSVIRLSCVISTSPLLLRMRATKIFWWECKMA